MIPTCMETPVHIGVRDTKHALIAVPMKDFRVGVVIEFVKARCVDFEKLLTAPLHLNPFFVLDQSIPLVKLDKVLAICPEI